MDRNYLNWVEQTLSKRTDGLESSYVEPSVAELVEMIEKVPTYGDNWKQSTDILVLPLTLDQYWDAFYADEAPYYVPAEERWPDYD